MSLLKKIDVRLVVVFVLAALSGAMLLHVSQMVQEAEDNLRSLEMSSRVEEEGVRVLNAEWSYLNNPQNLEALASDYLELKPVESESISSGDVPILVREFPETDAKNPDEGDYAQPVSMRTHDREGG